MMQVGLLTRKYIKLVFKFNVNVAIIFVKHLVLSNISAN